MLQDYSVHYINDVSGFQDRALLKLALEYRLSTILMHPGPSLPALAAETISDDFYLGGLEDELMRFFANRLKVAEEEGLGSVILDPGLGFAKNLKQSLAILGYISKLKSEFTLPILIGASRKRFLGLWLDLAIERLSQRDYPHGLIEALIEIAEEESGLDFDHDQIARKFFQDYPEAPEHYDEILIRDKLTALYNHLASLAGADYLRVHHPRGVLSVDR